jgi:phosphonate transport system permease protein
MSDTALGPRELARRWRPPPLIKSPRLRWALGLGAALYFAAAIGSLEVNWLRIYEGLDRGWAFVMAFAEPDFVGRWTDISQGMIESLVMTVTSTVIGITISVPIGLGAARNIAPLPVYLLCRGIIAVSRSFQEVIIAIFFVAIFGFGPLAGVLTLSFATIGFLSKLLAEDIEDIDKTQAEAVRATGGSWLQLMNYGIQPQVMPRLIGLSLYRLDINFRESAVVGLVGAGGIGATLNTAFDRYEFDTAAAILIAIIGIVMAAEYSSGLIRARVQ